MQLARAGWPAVGGNAGKAITATARACKLGDPLACTSDFGCVQRREVGYEGTVRDRSSVRVTRSVGVETIEECKRYCNKGLPGACYRAAQYLSTANKDAESRRRYQQACRLGDRRGCEITGAAGGNQ